MCCKSEDTNLLEQTERTYAMYRPPRLRNPRFRNGIIREKRDATIRKPCTVTSSASIRIFIQRPLVTGTGWLGTRCGVTMLPALGSVNRVRVQLAGRSQ